MRRSFRPLGWVLRVDPLGALAALSFVLLGISPTPLLAEPADPRAGDAAAATLLRVIDTRASPARTLEFTRADLEALAPATLDTTTVVTDGMQHFEGVLMRDLLQAAGVEDVETIVARALNDYEISIPVRDFQRFDVVAAMRQNGKPLTRRDKGPIWIVYPRDDHRVLQDIRYDYRWVWQLHEIEVSVADGDADEPRGRD